jgi:hypothetical protein
MILFYAKGRLFCPAWRIHGTSRSRCSTGSRERSAAPPGHLHCQYRG